MYLIDFCYIGNFALLYLINFAPQCQWLFVTCFVFANGCLASAIIAFRNSLVFHKIDMLMSLSIHCVPMILTLHMRWETIPIQSNLPLEEQRFAPLADMSTWSLMWHNFFVMPYLVYFVWLFFYGIFQFVLTDKVADGTVDSVYQSFSKSVKVPNSLSFIPTPILFLFFHFVYYTACHLVAVCLWYSYILNMFVAIFLMQWSIYQGANYYMDYFAKRYESQLAKLDKLEEVVVSTPTIRRQGSNRSNTPGGGSSSLRINTKAGTGSPAIPRVSNLTPPSASPVIQPTTDSPLDKKT